MEKRHCPSRQDVNRAFCRSQWPKIMTIASVALPECEARNKSSGFFTPAARFGCVSVQLSSCRQLGLPEGASAWQEGGSRWRSGRSYPKRAAQCQGKAAWENLALSQFCEQGKGEEEKNESVSWLTPSRPAQGLGGGWLGMSLGAFLATSLRWVRVPWCEGINGSPESSFHDRLVSALRRIWA